jgi:hypothetical protein
MISASDHIDNGRDASAGRLPLRATAPHLFSTSRHKANTLTNLEVASEACTQAFGTQALGTRLGDRLLAAHRFSTGS